MSQGIDTFFDAWEIEPGDSLRQKIDAGLGRCTHFTALLSKESIDAPWVKAEMDAAFVQKVSGRCRFISLRWQLPVESLPPLLQGLHSPELKDSGWPQIQVLPIVVTILGEQEIAGQKEDAEAKRVLVLCSDDLRKAINAIRRPIDADALFAGWIDSLSRPRFMRTDRLLDYS